MVFIQTYLPSRRRYLAQKAWNKDFEECDRSRHRPVHLRARGFPKKVLFDLVLEHEMRHICGVAVQPRPATVDRRIDEALDSVLDRCINRSFALPLFTLRICSIAYDCLENKANMSLGVRPPGIAYLNTVDAPYRRSRHFFGLSKDIFHSIKATRH